MGEAASPTPRFMRTSLFYGDGKRGSNGDVTFGRYRVRNVNDVGSFEFRIFEHRDYSQGTRTRQRAPRPPPPPARRRRAQLTALASVVVCGGRIALQRKILRRRRTRPTLS